MKPYISEKNGVYTDVLAVMELGIYEDPEESNKICDWLAETFGLTEGPVNPNGEMSCPVELTEDGTYMVYKAEYGYVPFVDLLNNWKIEYRKWKKEFGEE